MSGQSWSWFKGKESVFCSFLFMVPWEEDLARGNWWKLQAALMGLSPLIASAAPTLADSSWHPLSTSCSLQLHLGLDGESLRFGSRTAARLCRWRHLFRFGVDNFFLCEEKTMWLKYWHFIIGHNHCLSAYLLFIPALATMSEISEKMLYFIVRASVFCL